MATPYADDMDEAESAILSELLERLRATRRDRALSSELARWTDDIAVEFVGSDVRNLAVEISCEWENIVVAAHEHGDPPDMPHEFPDESMADYLARAEALR